MVSDLTSCLSRYGEIRKLNQYKITREAGSGAYSQVFLAQDEDKDKELAIKVIKKQGASL